MLFFKYDLFVSLKIRVNIWRDLMFDNNNDNNRRYINVKINKYLWFKSKTRRELDFKETLKDIKRCRGKRC